jgi:hypothetical protein
MNEVWIVDFAGVEGGYLIDVFASETSALDCLREEHARELESGTRMIAWEKEQRDKWWDEFGSDQHWQWPLPTGIEANPEGGWKFDRGSFDTYRAYPVQVKP